MARQRKARNISDWPVAILVKMGRVGNWNVLIEAILLWYNHISSTQQVGKKFQGSRTTFPVCFIFAGKIQCKI